MRHVILIGLGICLAQTAAAQTEVIIRRSGQPDQVIQLPDSAHRQRIELRLDSTIHRALDARTTAETQRVMAEQLKQSNGNIARVRIDSLQSQDARVAAETQRALAEQMNQLNGAIARVHIDSLQSQILALRMPEMARTTAELHARLANLRRQPHFGIAVDYRPRDTDRWGAYVMAVTPGSPAAQAGIMSGDIITRIDGKSISEKNTGSSRDDQSLPYVRLTTIIAQLQVGKPVGVELRRGTQTHTVRVTPDDDDTALPSIALGQPFMQLDQPSVTIARGFSMPTMAPRTQAFSVFSGNGGNFAYGFGADGLFANIELAPVNEKLGAYFGVTAGVLVVNTDNDRRASFQISWSGTADSLRMTRGRRDSSVTYIDGVPVAPGTAGVSGNALDLQPGDVITAVDGRTVTNPSQLMRIVASYDRGENFKLQIMRQKHPMSIPVKMP